MTDMIIAPSILAADFARLGEEVQQVITAGADWVHYDVMDNHYVPNLSIGPQGVKALREFGITAPIDVHLMVKPVDSLIVEFAKAGASVITIHPETTEHLDRSIQLIKDNGCQAGIALNPATATHHLDFILEKIDLILVMSVNPGFGGQSFIDSALEKLEIVRMLIDEIGLPIHLQIDGGVKVNNIEQIAKAGATNFVAGSAIFNSDDYAATIAAMRTAIAS